jgi:hypothetical protein
MRAAPAIALLAAGLVGCATSTDLGLLQRSSGGGMGGSLTGHWGFGAVEREVLTVGVDVRGDLADSGNRIAVGGSVLGGLPVGPIRALARAGIWRAATSNTSERGVVPTFEVAGFIPLRADHPTAERRKVGTGSASSGLIVGVREDLDTAAYTTIFVGVALFMVPGY